MDVFSLRCTLPKVKYPLCRPIAAGGRVSMQWCCTARNLLCALVFARCITLRTAVTACRWGTALCRPPLRCAHGTRDQPNPPVTCVVGMVVCGTLVTATTRVQAALHTASRLAHSCPHEERTDFDVSELARPECVYKDLASSTFIPHSNNNNSHSLLFSTHSSGSFTFLRSSFYFTNALVAFVRL